ncbi:putative alpha-L-fucosidase [Helianthus anomalus]
MAENNISNSNLKVRFSGEARHWTDALPIGNGRLGGMVWGGVLSETINLNGTLFSFNTCTHTHM